MRLRSLIIIIYILFPFVINGQSRKLDKKVAERNYNSGIIKFDDGTERECDLYFDWSTGIIYEKKGDVTLPHTAFKVISFEFVDDKDENKLRKFYSLPYKLSEAGLPESLVFFEVLYEKNNLAVLKFHYVEYLGVRATNNTSDPSFIHPQYSTVRNVYDKILLVKGNSGLKCLMESEGRLSGFWQDEKIYDKVNNVVLEEIFKEDYNALMTFIKSNDLKVKRVSELIHAIKHYKNNI